MSKVILAIGRIAVLSPLAAANGFVRSWPIWYIVPWTHISQPVNGILIGSAVFVQPTTQTHRSRYVWHRVKPMWPILEHFIICVLCRYFQSHAQLLSLAARGFAPDPTKALPLDRASGLPRPLSFVSIAKSCLHPVAVIMLLHKFNVHLQGRYLLFLNVGESGPPCNRKYLSWTSVVTHTKHLTRTIKFRCLSTIYQRHAQPRTHTHTHTQPVG